MSNTCRCTTRVHFKGAVCCLRQQLQLLPSPASMSDRKWPVCLLFMIKGFGWHWQPLQLTSCFPAAGSAGSTGFCDGQCCDGICSYDVANETYFCCALQVALHLIAAQTGSHQAAVAREILNPLELLHSIAQNCFYCLCAGPSGSAGHCSGECCSGETDVCVEHRGADAEACCAIRFTLSALRVALGR